MNKFIKFPLVLGVTAAICAGALATVYEITNPKIVENTVKATYASLYELVPDMTGAETITANYESATLSKYNVSDVYSIEKNNAVYAYGYQAEVAGYNPGIKFVVVLSASEEKILGFKVIEHQETNSGSYGGPLLNSAEFAEQFAGLSFSDLGTGVDFVAGSTAKTTLSAVKTGVDNVISFHKYEVLGQENDGINLTGGERTTLGLPEGQKMVDATDEFKAALKANTSTNKYNSLIENLNLLNFVKIVNSENESEIVGYAYIVENSYSCELAHGSRGTQTYKLVFQVDANNENSKVTVVATTDTFGALSNVPASSLAELAWVSENFNGYTISQLSDNFANAKVDHFSGVTFTTSAVKAHVAVIVDAHVRAFTK